MNIFLLLAFLSPLLVGLATPFLLAQYSKQGTKKAVTMLGGFVIAIAIILILLSVTFKVNLTNALKLCLFLAAFEMALAGGFYLLSILFNAKISQLLISLLVVAMLGTIFYFNPIIEKYEESGYTSGQIAEVCNVALQANPYGVVSGSIFGIDFIRENKGIYRNSLISLYNFRYPDWTKVLAGYIIFSVIASGFAILANFLRRRYGAG